MQDFIERERLLTTRLLTQGYQRAKLVSTLKKFYERHHNLVNPYNVAFSRLTSDIFAIAKPLTDLLNKANSTDTAAEIFFYLHLLVSNGFVSSQIYYKHDDFDLTLLISHFSCPLYTFLNLFGLQECLVIWLTSML